MKFDIMNCHHVMCYSVTKALCINIQFHINNRLELHKMPEIKYALFYGKNEHLLPAKNASYKLITTQAKTYLT